MPRPASEPKKVGTQILPITNRVEFRKALEVASGLLSSGRIVAVPSETVYGLAANALDAVAVEKIFRAKDRPSFNPLIVHVCDLSMAVRCASNWPEKASMLARVFWPGPLTLVVNKSPLIPEVVTGGGQTVALRWPACNAS